MKLGGGHFRLGARLWILTGLVCFFGGYGIAYWKFAGSSSTIGETVIRPPTVNTGGRDTLEEPGQYSTDESPASGPSEQPQARQIPNSAGSSRRSNPADEKSILDSVKQGVYREALELIVEWMSPAELLPLIAGFSGMDEEQLWEMEDPHAFGKVLAGFALEDCASPSLVSSAAEMLFTNTAGNRSLAASVHSVSRAAGRVYAHFDLPAGYPHASVLVRWCRASPLRNYLFGNYPINKRTNSNYVWFSSKQPEPGIYYVHIWSADENPALLSSGSYEVTE